jgi:hypothetical protein
VIDAEIAHNIDALRRLGGLDPSTG